MSGESGAPGGSVFGCWQQMLVTFLEELQAQVPDDEQVKAALQTAKEAERDQLMKEFAATLAPRHAIVMTNDPALFDGLVLLGIDFQAIWARDLAPESRTACHQYISMLYLLASTINSIPPQLLGTIESVAQSIASSVSQDDETPDIGSLFGALMGGATGGATGGANPLAALLGGGMASMLGGGGALAGGSEERSPPAARNGPRRLTFDQQPPTAPRKVGNARRSDVRKPAPRKKN